MRNITNKNKILLEKHQEQMLLVRSWHISEELAKSYVLVN